jgi:hypothetical protein
MVVLDIIYGRTTTLQGEEILEAKQGQSPFALGRNAYYDRILSTVTDDGIAIADLLVDRPIPPCPKSSSTESASKYGRNRHDHHFSWLL